MRPMSAASPVTSGHVGGARENPERRGGNHRLRVLLISRPESRALHSIPLRYAARKRSGNGSVPDHGLAIPPRSDLIHFPGEFFRSEDLLAKQDVGEGNDPAFVIAQFADHFSAERLDAAARFFGVDDLVEVENIGQRVAALLPGLQLVLHALDRPVSYTHLRAHETGRNLLCR